VTYHHSLLRLNSFLNLSPILDEKSGFPVYNYCFNYRYLKIYIKFSNSLRNNNFLTYINFLLRLYSTYIVTCYGMCNVHKHYIYSNKKREITQHKKSLCFTHPAASLSSHFKPRTEVAGLARLVVYVTIYMNTVGYTWFTNVCMS